MMIRVALILAAIQVAMAFRPMTRSVVRTSLAASNVAIQPAPHASPSTLVEEVFAVPVVDET